jgi:hypothetical protein
VAGWRTACLVAALALAGCTSDPKASEDNEPAATAATATIGADRRVELASLGLSFTLPESFRVEKDPDLVFVASSAELPAIVSVAPEGPEIDQHEAEGGESLTTISIDGAKALVVTDAVVEGLPPGIVANELMVSNGERSFSIIFSSPAPELAKAWEPFVDSISIG